MAEKTPNSLIEKIAITAAMLILVVIASFVIRYFYNTYDVTREPSYVDNLPAEGEYANIESIETHWQQDPITQKVYPYATITLASNSNSGSLRALFCREKSLNDLEQKVVGDPHTLDFIQGQFENGSNQITIKCSQGLSNLAEFLGYKNQDLYRWTIRVRESSGSQQRTSDFTALARAPIEPHFVEQES